MPLPISHMNRLRYLGRVEVGRAFKVVLRAARSMATSSGRFQREDPVIAPDEEGLIIRSPYSSVEIPETNLADYVWKDVAKWSSKVALVCGTTGRQYTYEEAHSLARKFGSALLRMGAKKGDILGMVLPNLPEFPIAFLGACGVGVTLTPMNPTYRPEEIARQLNNSGAKYIMTIDLFLPNVRQALEIYTGVEKIIVIGMDQPPTDCISFGDMVKNDDGSLYESDRSLNVYEDSVVLPYSSGTTGAPKGVQLTHHNMVSNITQMGHPEVKLLMDATDADQDINVVVLPFFHIYALNAIMTNCMQRGVKIVTLPKFEPESYVKALATFKPTVLNLVPPLVNFLTTSSAVKQHHLSSVRIISGGAAPLGPSLIKKFLEKVSPHVVSFREGYGLTETSPVTHFQPAEDAIIGSCGVCVPNTMAKVVDIETGKALGPNQDGELYIAGPQIMKGYYKNPEATNETIVDGWLRTGDIARYNEKQHFFIVDRLKELIKVKGLQVAPSELEDIIRRVEGVDDVAVIGIPDERVGELPRAYVIRRNRSLGDQQIIDFVAEKAAPHKHLTGGVFFVESLPKNQTGKILRRELKMEVFKGSFGY